LNRLYEGMFLFESREKADWEPYRDHALALLERHGAKVLRHERWAERKLAYEIKKVRRGIYFLTYFEADTDAIDTIRRDATLSDKILRVMIVRCDALPEEKKEEAPATEAKEGAPAEAPAGPAATPAPNGAEATPAAGGEEAADAPAESPAVETEPAAAEPKEEAPAEGASPVEGGDVPTEEETKPVEG